MNSKEARAIGRCIYRLTICLNKFGALDKDTLNAMSEDLKVLVEANNGTNEK